MSTAETLFTGIFGQATENLKEKNIERDSDFLNALEEGDQAGGQFIDGLVKNAVSEMETEANAFNKTFNEIDTNYRKIFKNTAPEFAANLQALLQQDPDAFTGDFDNANARVQTYFKSPTFTNIGENEEMLQQIRDAGGVIGEGAGIDLLEKGMAANRRTIYDAVGNIHTTNTRDLLLGVDPKTLEDRRTPERFKEMETDSTAIQEDVATMVDNFQLTNPLGVNSVQLAAVTNWVPSLTYEDVRSNLVLNNPSLANDPLALQRATFLVAKDNIDAVEMKYGTGAVEKLRADGLIVSQDTIASFKSLEDAAVSGGISRRLDDISKNPNDPNYPVVQLFNARQPTLDPSKPEDLEIISNFNNIRSNIEAEERNLIKSTGYFDDRDLFISSVVGQERDTRMHVKDTDSNKIYSFNPNVTPEGNFVLYGVDDPSDKQIFNIDDIFPVDGKPAKLEGTLSPEKLKYFRTLVEKGYSGGRDQFYIDLINGGFKLEKPTDLIIEEAELEAQKSKVERFSRPLTDEERRTFARTGKLPEGVEDLTGPKTVSEIFDMGADKFQKNNKPYKLTRKQRKDYQSTGKLPEGVTKVE